MAHIALEKLRSENINAVITDERMPGMSGMEVLRETKKYDARIPVIILTGYGTIPLTINALKEGAFHFFEKPVSQNLEKFYSVIEDALKTQELQSTAREQQSEIDNKSNLQDIMGNSEQDA